MDLPYKDQPHAKGDSSYIVNEEDEDEDDEVEAEQEQIGVEVIPSELEKRDKKTSEDFSELIKIESKAGKLNKDVVYLNIASMKSGDIFVSFGKVNVNCTFNLIMYLKTTSDIHKLSSSKVPKLTRYIHEPFYVQKE